MKSGIFFFLFASSLLILCVNGEDDIITSTCKKVAENPNVKFDFCVSSLQSDPSSQSAKDLQELGLISIKLIKAETTSISSHVSNLLNEATDPDAKKALEDCSEGYSDAVDDVDEANNSFISKDYGSANIQLSAVLDAASTCEDGFKDSELQKKSKDYSGLVEIGLAITNMFN